MPSIHRKITASYGSMAAVIAALALFAFLDHLYLERRVHEGVVVQDFKDATLEMRRYEKNLFLYEDRDTALELMHFVQRAGDILNRERLDLRSLAPGNDLDALQADLSSYAVLVARYFDGEAPALQEEIRAVGHRISSNAEQLAGWERQTLAEAVARSRWALAVSFLLVVPAVVLVGRGLSKAVMQPLRELVQDLEPVAEGRLDRLGTRSKNQELVTFAQAINHVLDELELRRRRLLQSEKLAALGTLAAGVAHEINNPLSNISSSAQLLAEELEGTKQTSLKAWASQIVGETERANRTVSALLEFGRRQEFVLEPVELKKLLQKTLLLLRSPVRASGAEVSLRVPAGLEVLADAQRLQQVFINLIRNALLARENGAHVVVTAARCDEAVKLKLGEGLMIGEPQCEGAGAVQIEVADDGPGIPPDVLPRIFEPFFTARDTGQGMGLGLYIVQDIVQQLGGCIGVASEMGRGTRVLLQLRNAEEPVRQENA